MVDRYFVVGAFLAVLYHCVRSCSWVGVSLLVEGDIVLTANRHAHGMVLELVFFNGIDLVDLDTLGTGDSREALRTGAGVWC
jgi:hypothetical protein